MATRPVLPSDVRNRVGTPDASISGLHTRPARTPVNASPSSSRTPTHDSGTVWLATPSPSGTFIHYTSPALPAHCGVDPAGIAPPGIVIILSAPVADEPRPTQAVTDPRQGVE